MKSFKVSNRDGFLWPDDDTACWEWLQNEIGKVYSDVVFAFKE